MDSHMENPERSSLVKPIIYTIGHSNVPAKKIIDLLRQNGIQVLVDVRSSPYSKYVPQFNREMLQDVLQREGLDYKYAGEYLGGRPKDSTCYKNGVIPDGHADFLQLVDYPAVMTKEWYQKGIERLLDIAREKPTAIMCSEEDPARCHRQHLISQTLLKQGIEVLHIRSDGSLQKAWLLEEKSEVKPAEQLSIFSITPLKDSEKISRTEPEMDYEQVDDAPQAPSQDFFDDASFPSSQMISKKKVMRKANKKQQEDEMERLQKWIEKNKRY